MLPARCAPPAPEGSILANRVKVLPETRELLPGRPACRGKTETTRENARKTRIRPRRSTLARPVSRRRMESTRLNARPIGSVENRCGTLRLAVVPSPSCPLLFEPQTQRLPSALRAALVPRDAETDSSRRHRPPYRRGLIRSIPGTELPAATRSPRPKFPVRFQRDAWIEAAAIRLLQSFAVPTRTGDSCWVVFPVPVVRCH